MSMKLNSRGSAVAEVVIGAAILVFAILPVFSAIVERYVLLNKVQMIRDAADITNISVYNAMNTAQLGKTNVIFEADKAMELYKELLAKNMKLDPGLVPLNGSIAEGTVKIESLEFYMAGFPLTCPDGTVLERAAVHSCIRVPVKPSLYRRAILTFMGREYIELKIHVDSDIPLNR